MKKFLAMYLIKFLLNTYLADKTKGQIQSYEFLPTSKISAMIDTGSKLSWGFLIALVVVVLCGLYMAADEKLATTAAGDAASSASSSEQPTEDSTGDTTDYASKIIYSGNITIQSTEFDKALAALEKSVQDAGGFIETSNVSGNTQYREDGTTEVVDRVAYYTVRVPAEKFDGYMTKGQIFFKITLLQMIKRIVPPISNEIITLVKDTSLARIIALQEVIWAGQTFAKSKGIIWPLFFTGVYFLVFSGILTLLLGRLEKKLGYFN